MLMSFAAGGSPEGGVLRATPVLADVHVGRDVRRGGGQAERAVPVLVGDHPHPSEGGAGGRWLKGGGAGGGGLEGPRAAGGARGPPQRPAPGRAERVRRL